MNGTLGVIKARVIGCLVGLAVLGGPSVAIAQGLDDATLQKCMAAIVLQHEDAKKLKFNGHEFNCKGLSGWQTTDGVTKVAGRLSHHLSGRPDDQVDWSFNLDDKGVVSDVDLRIERGGVQKLYRNLKLPEVVVSLPGGGQLPTSPAALSNLVDRQLMSWTGRMIDGSWEGAAQALVGGIGTQLSLARMSMRLNDVSRSPVYYYNIAPRENPDNGFSLAARGTDPASCRKACKDSAQCKVWSFQNRRRSDGKAGELHCKLFNQKQFDGFRNQTRSVSGRVRN